MVRILSSSETKTETKNNKEKEYNTTDIKRDIFPQKAS